MNNDVLLFDYPVIFEHLISDFKQYVKILLQELHYALEKPAHKNFTANGYDIIINGRRTERLENLADRLKKII